MTRRTAPADHYQASRPGTRLGFLGLSAVVTFTVLVSMGQIADHQVENNGLLAQASVQQLAQAGAAAAPRHPA